MCGWTFHFKFGSSTRSLGAWWFCAVSNLFLGLCSSGQWAKVVPGVSRSYSCSLGAVTSVVIPETTSFHDLCCLFQPLVFLELHTSFLMLLWLRLLYPCCGKINVMGLLRCPYEAATEFSKFKISPRPPWNKNVIAELVRFFSSTLDSSTSQIKKAGKVSLLLRWRMKHGMKY